MESFIIQLLSNHYKIEPQDNGTYRIMEGESKLGVIYPEPADDRVVWHTQDNLDINFVQQLGELITEHNM